MPTTGIKDGFLLMGKANGVARDVANGPSATLTFPNAAFATSPINGAT
jgi:hypothetical protein